MHKRLLARPFFFSTRPISFTCTTVFVFVFVFSKHVLTGRKDNPGLPCKLNDYYIDSRWADEGS